ncbi:MAG: GGDEF domain-containing protein [Lachnospiraceae bacterium]
MKVKNLQIKDRITKQEFDDWFRITLIAFRKIWLVTFLIEFLLFLFYKPNPECGRLRYFWLFIIKPSGLMMLALIIADVYHHLKKNNFRRIQTSLTTIFVISSFCAAAIWIHTSVQMMVMLLMVPLFITSLYKNQLMTWLQLVICIFIYVMYELYFYPHSIYLPPLNSFINISIFIGSILVELFLIQHMQAYVEIVEKKGNYDSMTGLYNHKLFYDELESTRQAMIKKQLPAALLVMDIDHFKLVNDTYGHVFGDKVICTVAEILTSVNPRGFCARYGGEEFAIIFTNLPFEDALQCAEQIRKQFEDTTFQVEKGPCHFTLSIGAAAFDPSFSDARTWFEKADAALYRAKENGRNRVCK